MSGEGVWAVTSRRRPEDCFGRARDAALGWRSISMRSSFTDPADLVVAPATVPGDGARAIVRLSGEGLARLLGELLVPEVAEAFLLPGAPRCVTTLFSGELAAVWGPLAVEVLWWPGPAGPTGGPLAELQLPASAPLVDAVVAAACRHGARMARGGEFTLRSFLAGRLDLVQAEAVLAVVEAASPEALSEALDRMAGGAGRRLQAVRESLLDLLADVEAVIDFADERSPDHVAAADGGFWDSTAERLAAAARSLDAALMQLAGRDAAAGELPRVVLVGRPNIGKSSLFNALADAGLALVADEAGTTRDWIGARLEGAGTGCMLVDLAGVDRSARGGAVADAAMEVARAEIARADVLVVCRDAVDSGAPPDVPPGVPRIDVWTRCDRLPLDAEAADVIATSCRDRRGIEALRGAIIQAVLRRDGKGSPATVRMRVGVEAAQAEVTAARAAVADALRDEAVVAGHLGRAVGALDGATGKEIGADLLDRIFARHCIGK